MDQDFLELQNNIGYSFSDKNLMKCAFLHASADAGENYERLEFLGDAVLELIISEVLYFKKTSSPEGELTKFRAALVNEENLVTVARDLGLGGYIVLGRGERNTGGEDKPSILSDVFEALTGAVYIDGGYEQAKKMVLKLLDDSIETVLSGGGFKDYKTKLQEYYHKKGTSDIRYIVFREEGPPHSRVFYVNLIIDGEEKAQGKGSSKKNAEQRAAKQAYLQVCEKH
jgi:ribonuclease III